MNTQLEKLFELHGFSSKDRYDFMQIYSLLPSHKRVKVVENFSGIAENIGSLKKELLLEQEILFGNTLSNIEEKLKALKKEKISSQIQNEIAFLKNTI